MTKTPLGAAVFRDGFYLTYPHNNGFFEGGRRLVLGRRDGRMASLWRVAVDSRDEERICEFDVSSEAERLLWFDVAREANRLVLVRGNEIWLHDLGKPDRGEILYRAEPPAQLLSLASITSDGHKVVAGLHFPDRYAALLLEVDSGTHRILFEKPWCMGHFHFSPYDEEWIGFCHEGSCEEVRDRVWGWHAVHAPAGRCLFDQQWDDLARRLCVGHERWCFHEKTVLAVAYGASPGEPRGIYELSASGEAPRLISQGNRHWHVSPSSSGRWAVIDTSGPHDLAGKGWENANGVSDILLLAMAGGEPCWLARSRAALHPSHPHPVFSPDEKRVFFNELTSQGNRVMSVANPWFSA